MVDETVIDEFGIELSEVTLESSGEGHSHVGHFVVDEAEHVVLEVLFEEILGLVHHFAAHDHEKLSSLERRIVSASEVVLDNFEDRSLLLHILAEFQKDGSEGSGSGFGNLGYTFFAELEEHGEEFSVDNVEIEQSDIVAEVLCKELLSAPVCASLVKSLQDVLDVLGTLLRLHLGQEHV